MTQGYASPRFAPSARLATLFNTNRSGTILTACYLINQISSSILQNQIPYSILCPQMILFSMSLKIFGYMCFVQNNGSHKTKLDSHTFKCIILGYFWTQKGYRCYCPSQDRFLVSAHATFFSLNLSLIMRLSSLESEDDNMFFLLFKIHLLCILHHQLIYI